MRSQLVVAALAFCVALATVPSGADARPRPARNTGKKFEANKGFGIGLMLGVPAGLSGKYYIGSDTALDFGVGSHFGGRRYDTAFSIHGDFLWHPIVLADPAPFWLPLYVGVGARFLDHNNGNNDGHDTHLGIRVPVGILMDFNDVPFDAFFEVALVVDFIRDDGRHGYSDLHTAIGGRYYFN